MRGAVELQLCRFKKFGGFGGWWGGLWTAPILLGGRLVQFHFSKSVQVKVSTSVHFGKSRQVVRSFGVDCRSWFFAFCVSIGEQEVHDGVTLV